MGVEQPVFLHEDQLPAIPSGWHWSRSDSLVVQLKPGKLFDTKSVAITGAVPVLNQSESGAIGYHDEEPGVVASPCAPVVTFANHTCAMRLVKHPFSAIQNIFPKIGREGVCETVWFYYALLGRVRANEYKGHHPLFRDAFVPVPPIATQRRIASILSAYDDLIENNTRRIMILEEMARHIYDEWFVRLRFPGHNALRTEQGLPSEWPTVPLGAVTTKIGSGATPRGGKSAYLQVGVPLIRSQNVYDNRFDEEGLAFLDANQAASLEGATVRPEDVLINITGASVARCCMAPRRYVPARVNQHVMIIRADKARISPIYLLCVINSERRKRELLAYAQSGATREALTKDRMSQFELVIPSREVLLAFEGSVGAMFQQREVLAEQASVLKTTRDLLLPKLISGELDVSAMPEPGVLTT